MRDQGSHAISVLLPVEHVAEQGETVDGSLAAGAILFATWRGKRHPLLHFILQGDLGLLLFRFGDWSFLGLGLD